jgi:prepilin peptidase CpaA
MTHLLLTQICVTALVTIAALTDLRSRRIPNWLTLSGVVAGLLLQTALGGFSGLKMSAGGLVLGFGSYLALYCVRAMGAGDVKLMAAVGAIVGPWNWVFVFVATALAGGVLSVILMAQKGRTKETLWNVWFIVTELMHLRLPYQKRKDLDVKDSRALTMPHGVAIAAGTLLCLLSARIA